MNWHASDIKEAIHKVKKESRVLLVFIKDEDIVSKSVDDMFDAETAALCKEFVCLRLDHTSEAAKQFSGVYTVLTVPCVYLIASSGQVIGVKPGQITKAELLAWISKATEEHGQVTSPSPLACNSAPASRLVQRETDQSAQPTSVSTPPPENCSSLEHVYQRMDENRHKRLAEEQAKSIQDELKRRETAKSLQDFKERQAALEIEEAIAERRRDKAESLKLRERLKREIQEDRRAFRERTQIVVPQTTAAQNSGMTEPTQSVRPTSPNDLVRLQLRLPGGNRLIGCFAHTATVAGDLRNWLNEIARTKDSSVADEVTLSALSTLINRGYRVRQLHPPKLLEPEDETHTMADLGLFPSAVLLLIPSSSTNSYALQTSGGGVFTRLYGLVSTFFVLAYNCVTWMFGGIYSRASGLRTQSNSNASPNQSRTQLPRDDKQRTSSPNLQPNRAVLRQGNTARLSHMPDTSDDEQARWNGNSTTQL